PELAALFARSYTPVGVLWADPVAAARALWGQLTHPNFGVQRYVEQALLRGPFPSEWLALDGLGAWWISPLNLAIAAALRAVSGVAVAGAVMALARLVRGHLTIAGPWWPRRWRRRWPPSSCWSASATSTSSP